MPILSCNGAVRHHVASEWKVSMAKPQRLQVQGVTKDFGGVRALDAISLDVQPGELVSILGASGCGKSTLLRVVAGLERAQGEVLIGGELMSDRTPSERGVAFVFQSYALYPHMTVAENLAAPLVMRELSSADRIPVVGRLMPGAASRRSQIAKQVRHTAEMLQIGALLDRKPLQLSGGQRQRVALGRALIRDPSLFLLDEPLANLDAALRQQTRSELRSLQQRLETTTLFVTHDQAEAMAISDRIAIMADGRIFQFATPDELYRRPVSIEVARFLAQPALNTMVARSSRTGSVETQDGFVLGLRTKPGKGTLAFRPEHASLNGPDGSGLPVVVQRREHAGSHAHVFVLTTRGQEGCVIRVPSEALARWVPGAEAAMEIDPDAAWFFPEPEDRANDQPWEHAPRAAALA